MWRHRWRSRCRCKYENASVNKWRQSINSCAASWKWMGNNPPDLNSVDYSIWRALQQLVYRCRRIQGVENLKEVVQTCWEQIGHDVIWTMLSQTIANDCRSLLQPVERTHWAPLWPKFLLLRVHYHTYVFCCRNTELGQQKVNSPVYSAPHCMDKFDREYLHTPRFRIQPECWQ